MITVSVIFVCNNMPLGITRKVASNQGLMESVCMALYHFSLCDLPHEFFAIVFCLFVLKVVFLLLIKINQLKSNLELECGQLQGDILHNAATRNQIVPLFKS